MSITKLLVTQSEAEKLVQNQIHRGKAITSSIDLDEVNINKSVEKVDKWEEETRQVLLDIFDSEELADEFTGAAQLYQKGSDFYSKLSYTDSRITYKNYALEDIIKRLSFYSETIKQPQELDVWTLIHPAISGVSKSRFDASHYADAVETAFKYINETIKNKVKKKTGKELDGASLMNTAFSPNSPIIVLDDLSTDSGKNIQQGFMQIFAGSMTGIRNPKAHGVVSIDKEQAVHFLFLASLLMNKYDDAI